MNEPLASRTLIARRIAQTHGYDLDAALQIGGNYASYAAHGDLVYVSGQIPRIGNSVAVAGRVGATVSLAEAQRAAEICTLRALAVLHQAYGLARLAAILKLNVFVQSAEDFTQQSEVADAASNLLASVFGDAGKPTRTSVGVYQLPKNAAVELDLVAALCPAAGQPG